MHLIFNAGKVPEILASNLQGYSWSFSHFFLWRGLGVQFDCGEGSAIRLDDHVFRSDVLAISHSHSDHCRGLPGLLEARSGLKGANDKPLKIISPRNSKGMEQWLSQARTIVSNRHMENVSFREIGSGETEVLRNGRILEAMEVLHEKGELCLAYRIMYSRKRLRSEFESLSSKEVAALVRTRPRHELEEECEEYELVYSGDTKDLAPQFYSGAQLLIHEASFLYAADADPEKGIHANIQDVLGKVRDAGVRSLVLFHSSRRYETKMLQMSIASLIEAIGVKCPVMLIRGSFNLATD